MDTWEELEKKVVEFFLNGNNQEIEIETFTWEKLDFVDKVKKVFDI